MEERKNEQALDPPSRRWDLSSAAVKTRLPRLKEHIAFWSITVFGTALDLWSKSAVFNWLEQQPDQRFSIIDGFLHFVMALNDGAAFGSFPGQRYLLITVSVVALIVILGVFLFSGTHQTVINVSLGLFAAGVGGNLYDRIFNTGLVRDFIDIVYWPGRHWPAFNVADSMLCIAVGLMLLSSLFTETSSRKRVRQRR
ncbi:MAG: signal peptidase II [Planctomycetota bacterium]